MAFYGIFWHFLASGRCLLVAAGGIFSGRCLATSGRCLLVAAGGIFSGRCLLVAAGGIFSGAAGSVPRGTFGAASAGVVGCCRVLSGVVGCCRVLSGVVGCCRVLGGGGGLGAGRHPPGWQTSPRLADNVKNFHNVVFVPPSAHRPDVARHRPDVALMEEDTAHMEAATAHGRHPLPRCPQTLILVTFCQNISACQLHFVLLHISFNICLT